MAAAINDDREQQFETRLYKGTKSPLRAHNLTTGVRAFAGGAGKNREKQSSTCCDFVFGATRLVRTDVTF